MTQTYAAGRQASPTTNRRGHLDVLRHEFDVRASSSCCGSQEGGPLTTRRIQVRAEHSGVSDGNRTDVPQFERVGIPLRLEGGVSDRPGAGLPDQLSQPPLGERPLDI